MLDVFYCLLNMIVLIIMFRINDRLQKYVDETIRDMEMDLAALEVQNTKLENEIKTISQNLNLKI